MLQNEEAPKEWFILVTDNEHGLPAKLNNSQAGYKMQSSPLAQVFFKSIAPEQPTLTMTVSPEPLEVNGELLWPIITSSYQKYLKKQ